MLRSSKSLREAIREPVDRLHCAWAQGEVLDRLGATDEALGVLQWALAGLAERPRFKVWRSTTPRRASRPATEWRTTWRPACRTGPQRR